MKINPGLIALGIVAAVTLAAAWPRADVAAVAAPPRVDFGQATALSYDQMARTPDQFKGKPVCLKGQALQVPTSAFPFFNVNIGEDLLAPQLTNVIGSYRGPTLETRILANDMVELCGTFAGTYEYETVLRAHVTAPLVNIDAIRQTADKTPQDKFMDDWKKKFHIDK
jgi:hypothetical protein